MLVRKTFDAEGNLTGTTHYTLFGKSPRSGPGCFGWTLIILFGSLLLLWPLDLTGIGGWRYFVLVAWLTVLVLLVAAGRGRRAAPAQSRVGIPAVPSPVRDAPPKIPDFREVAAALRGKDFMGSRFCEVPGSHDAVQQALKLSPDQMMVLVVSSMPVPGEVSRGLVEMADRVGVPASALAPPTDPNLLWDTRQRLDAFDVLRYEEIEATVAVILTMGDVSDHGRVYALLDPAFERFRALHDEDQLAFKDALNRFVRTYSFLSQVVSFGDSKLERDSIYCRALAARLRTVTTSERLDLGSEVELTHLRHEATFDGSLSPDGEEGEVVTIYGEGAGKQHEPPVEHLSQIIDELNKRFGLDLNDADKVLFDQLEQTWASDETVLAQARANTYENFRLAFDPRFMSSILRRMSENEEIVARILDTPELETMLKDWYAKRVYQRANDPDSGPPRGEG